MKILIPVVVVFLLFGACQNQKSSRSAGAIVSEEETKVDSSAVMNNEIISSAITNKEGITLKQTFNNSMGTCILELNGERIELQQERTASGIRYSNEHFTYTNWHGETHLYKDGSLIFSHSE